jgi:hypothetical protein
LSIVLLSVGSGSASKAGDMQGTVYIDGRPCNTACQSYMAWSRRILNNNMMRNSMNRAMPFEPYGGMPRSMDLGMAGVRPLPHEQAAAPLPDRARARASAAAAVAQQLTNSGIAASELRAMNDKRLDPGAGARGGSRHGTSGDDDKQVALLVTRPEIKSLAELAGKDVAVDVRDVACASRLRSAMAAAGAAEIHVSSGPAKPIDRLALGEVPAAVLTLASSDIADLFPDIAGFTLFRLPLSSRSLEGRAASPALR